MAIPRTLGLKVPSNDLVLEGNLISRVWRSFFDLIKRKLDPLGEEQSFQLTNNLGVAADITGLTFDKAGVSQAIIDYVIQRVTTGGGATELIEAGIKYVVYKPTTAAWAIGTFGTPGPGASGVTLTITATGQVQYTSSNITGTASISRIVWRARTLAAKSSQYSQPGAYR